MKAKPIAILRFNGPDGQPSPCTAILTPAGGLTIRKDKDGTIIRKHPATHVRRFPDPRDFLHDYYDHIPIDWLHDEEER